jgi:hypothetical protein
LTAQTVTVSSSRTFTVAGFVNTSRERVDTVVRQDVNFNNAQNFNVNATTFVQDITQDTTVNSRTTTRKGEAAFSTTESFQYPVKLNLDFSVASDGSASQQTTASQEFKVDLREPFFASSVDNTVNRTDTSNFDASFAFTGNTGRKARRTTASPIRAGRLTTALCKLKTGRSLPQAKDPLSRSSANPEITVKSLKPSRKVQS